VPVGHPAPERASALLGVDGALVRRGEIVASTRRMAPGTGTIRSSRRPRSGGRQGTRRRGSSAPATSAGSGGGLLEFAGGTDRQRKVRGYRVEPAEIEAALRGSPGVAPAAGAALEGGALADRFTAVLPAHQRPRAIRVLPASPTLPNLKHDLAALEALDAAGEEVPALDAEAFGDGKAPSKSRSGGPGRRCWAGLVRAWADLRGSRGRLARGAAVPVCARRTARLTCARGRDRARDTSVRGRGCRSGRGASVALVYRPQGLRCQRRRAGRRRPGEDAARAPRAGAAALPRRAGAVPTRLAPLPSRELVYRCARWRAPFLGRAATALSSSLARRQRHIEAARPDALLPRVA
jgi:hypothetical protein